MVVLMTKRYPLSIDTTLPYKNASKLVNSEPSLIQKNDTRNNQNPEKTIASVAT